MAFAYYSPITVDHTKVPSTQTNFPVLVSVTDNRLKTTGNGGHVQNGSGFDIRPYSDTGLTTAITAYELERYNASTGEVIMWVSIASLSSSVDSVFYLAYGDSGLSTDGSSNTTWDANYFGVWHLKDGTTLSLADSTSNANTLTNTASVAATSGKVDGGAGTFNGTTQALRTPSISFATNKVTMSMWLDVSSFPGGDKLLAESSTNFNNNNAFICNPNSSTTSQWDITARRPVGGGYNGGWFTRPSTGLHYYVFTYDTTTGAALSTAAWVDGVSQSMTQNNSNVLGSINFDNAVVYFMSRAATSLFMAGNALDEIRLSKILRAQDWITTEYNNQNAPGSFETLGTEVPVGGGPVVNGNFLVFM